MKRIIVYQLSILAIATALMFIFGARHAVQSYLSGGLLITGNFILLGLGWKMVFSKKLIALSVLIIVFKYAILGVIIYLLVKQSWLLPFWFAAGITSIMMAALIYGLTLGFFKEE
ncbi:MAG: hypothetical protein EOP06_10195 [Proteobacteria bacterium]|nr:MAG: hypothetical protein EOP06_10195 [Pseudomonadota bacterium]